MPYQDPFGSIAPGELRHRVVFQKPIEGQSDTGAKTTSWVNVLTAWARVEPLAGKELYSAQQLYPETNTTIIVRGLVGKMLEQKMRALFRGHQYDIVDIVDVDERRVEARVMAIQRPTSRAI